MQSLIFRLLAATWLALFVVPASGADIRRASPQEYLTLEAEVILEGKMLTILALFVANRFQPLASAISRAYD
jgi:hypothetical protein